MAYGAFRIDSIDEGLSATRVVPNSGPKITAGATLVDRPWLAVTAGTTGALNLRVLRDGGGRQASMSYLSFWLYSPKALDNLLLDPPSAETGIEHQCRRDTSLAQLQIGPD